MEVFHNEMARLDAHVVLRADVRMIERRERLRLPPKPLTEHGVRVDPAREDLDRNGPVQPGVAGLVDLAHAAGASRGKDFVGTEPLGSIQRHGVST